MMSSISSSRCQDLMLPRVKDLECSREWIGLTYDIDNLERMKSRAKWKNIQSENTGALLKSTCRQVTNRHSALELNEPSIVFVHMTTSEDLVHKLQETDNRSGSAKCVSPGEYTESYFNDNNSTDIDKVLRKDESRRSYQENVKDGDRCRIENSASLENPRRSVLNTDSPSYRDKSHSVSSQRTDKTDILFYPGSDEFRGSRERLHEIFEHNRLLRRRFFNDMPGEPKDSHSRGISTCGQIGMIKSRLEIPKHNSGFGSTETLTSQSNQSGVSSTNGRKSRGDFENCSEFIFDQFNQIQEDNVSDRDTVGVTESNRFSVSRSINRSAIESISEYNLPRFQPEQIPNYTDDQSASEHRKYLRDSGLPTFQTMDYKDCLGNVEEKFFATRARIKEFPETQVVVRRCNRPTPLDLKDRVNRTYSAIYESECKMIKNYTAEELTPALHGDEKTYINLMALGNDRKLSKNFNDRDNEFALKSSKSLGELSAKATQPITNKSCSDISTVEDLRSPQLVNSFSNSLIDLSMHELSTGQRSLQLSDDDLNADCGKSIDSSIPGTGTTLPLIYGPLPYKSPRRYVEGEVTIHYRSPVRTEAKEILSEEELARRSAENMRRVYQEERRRKYLQELHDIDSRRHTDNFIPSQKSPIPLNRYDDFVDDLSYRSRSQEQTPEPRLVARALYNFVGQTSRELSFRRGDIILIRRQIDKNWYEGEHNAMVGLFPLNHVEILPYDGARTTPKKPYEGQARAKFNFIAQTNLELSLAKGELVVLTRRVDENWYEGRIGNKKGIFPVSYVEVIMEPGQHRPETPVSSKPVASPAAHSMLSNGTASGKMSMGPHHYTPSIPVKTNTTEPQYISLPRIGVTERNKLHVAPVNETLHIDTHSDTIPYRALYNYRPQNEDELELKEGDTVYVIEKCDDGWFVGSSQRTGYFGTFPGNYVERL